MGAGGLMVGAQAIIADIVPPRERGRYMGVIGSVFAVSSVAGPLLGGFLVEAISWRWVFYVNMPIGVLAVLVVVFRLHLHAPAQRHTIDYLGAGLLTAGVSALVLVTTWGGTEYAWGSATILGLAAGAVAMLGTFVWQERRAAEPIIPLGLFRSSVFRVATGLGFVIGLAMFGAIIFIPLFLQLVYGVSPTSSGLRMLPLMLGLLSASILSGRAITRIGRYKAFPVAGTAITAIGMFLLSRLAVDTAPWVASVYMLVVGVGIGLVMQVLVLVVQNDAGARDVGVATATATFFRSMGGSLGVALFGAIFASRLTHELTALPAAAAARLSGGVNIRPEQLHGLPAGVRHDFLLAFVNALQPVFLVGAGLTAVAFALSLLLREVPLRDTTQQQAGIAADAARAGASATGSHAVIPAADAAPRTLAPR
jgi:EmrB/QacA subfamily drug resistance transporter